MKTIAMYETILAYQIYYLSLGVSAFLFYCGNHLQRLNVMTSMITTVVTGSGGVSLLWDLSSLYLLTKNRI